MPTKELYANSGNAFLVSSITSSATSLQISGGTWPSTGNFMIIVDAELMEVTAVSGTTFTITRAQESTPAATHNAGTIIISTLTDGSLRRLCRQTLNGTSQTARREINIVGAGCTMTDDATNDKVDIFLGIGVGTTLPSSPATGEKYFLTTDSTLNIYNGSAWKKSGAFT